MDALADAFDSVVANGDADTDAQVRAWMGRVDPRAHVNSRHHVVPRSMLARWANRAEQVRVYSRIEGKFSPRNVRDLALRDFYTVVNLQGEYDSHMESLLGVIEADAEPVLRKLLSAFNGTPQLTGAERAAVSLMVAFQIVRTPRFRRELELQAEWWAKSMAGGTVPDEELRKLTITPHQNESIQAMGAAAQRLFVFIAARPMALVTLDAPLLYTADDPVVVFGGEEDEHHPDCFLSDAEFNARMTKERRKKAGKRKGVRRFVHLRSTAPKGVGVADEVILPVSPRAALVLGPLLDGPDEGPVRRERLTGQQAVNFADFVNDVLATQALDWIIGRMDDPVFEAAVFPAPGPLMRVCDGSSPASEALNGVPARLRPARIWND